MAAMAQILYFCTIKRNILNIAVILAGGLGKRMGGSTPKQLIEMAGKTILEHSVDVFEAHAQIDEIALVVHESLMPAVEAMVVRRRWTKVRRLLRGGNERYQSSLSAIEAYQNVDDARLLIHDAVRPFVSPRIIDDVVAALKSYRAVNVALPATDTMIEVDASGSAVVAVPDRQRMFCVQTPQGFWLPTIRAAYARALQDPTFHATDDCGVVFKYLPDEQIFVVRGETANRKITFKEDLI